MQRQEIVFVDVDTQADFMLPEGKLYVPGAETIIPTLERLFAYARAKGVPVISSADAHTPNDPEFSQFPPHCVKGTSGQQKLPCTLLPDCSIVPNDWRIPLPEASRAQWILEKQALDVFTNVHTEELLHRLPAERYIVFGVVTEYCVRAAVLGLRQRGFPVQVVLDAIRAIDDKAGAAALDEMRAAGAELVRTEEVLRAAAA